MKVDSSITNLKHFAKYLDTDLVTLKTFNAWLIGETLTNNDKHTYSFKIPKNKNLDISLYFNDVFPPQKPHNAPLIDSVSVTNDTTIILQEEIKSNVNQ